MTWWTGRRYRALRRRGRSGYCFGDCLSDIDKVCVVQSGRVGNEADSRLRDVVVPLGGIKR